MLGNVAQRQVLALGLLIINLEQPAKILPSERGVVLEALISDPYKIAHAAPEGGFVG